MVDIAAASTAMRQSSLSLAIGIKVLAMAKNQAEQQGQNVVQMMGQSLNPNAGQKLDIKV